ncbi:MAG: hypothetical protein PF517_17330 [Salinivirgaceae bacterium]|jgi:hypothetical protein|nr:hypothetical protein [Salinivirgaceae bacterium]
MKPIYILAILSVLIASACKNDKARIIADYEYLNNITTVSSVEIRSSFKPFYGKDSVVLIKALYDSTLNKKLGDLNTQWNDKNNTKIKAQNTLTELDNLKMIQAFENRIQFMEFELLQIEKIISTYKNHPELTQLNALVVQKDNYNSRAESLLGYTINVKISGKQGYLPEQQFQKIYLFNDTKTTIKGIIEP